jgi:ferredoxin
VTEEAAHRLRIVIDRNLCMGSGNCVYWAAEVFDVGEDSVAVVVGDPGEHEPRVRLAAEHCPTHAISLDDRG